MLIPIIAFLAIGLGFFLSGCNSDVSDTCINYIPVSFAIVKETNIKNEKVYTVCIDYCGGNTCCRYSSTTRYDVVSKLKMGSNSTFCHIKIAENVTYSTAEKKANRYKPGKTIENLYKEKNGNTCITSGTAKAYWIVGVTFLSLTGLIVLTIFVMIAIENYDVYLMEKAEEAKRTATTENQKKKPDKSSDSNTNPINGKYGEIEKEFI